MVDLIFAGGLLLASPLIVMNGVFVTAESAFVKLWPTRVDAPINRRKPGAGLVQDIIENLDGYFAASQPGITLSSLGFGWIGEPVATTLIEPTLGELLPAGAIHLIAFTLRFDFITFLHAMSDELAPKTPVIQEVEWVAFLVAPLIKFFHYVFIPGIIIFNGTANYFTNPFNVSPAAEGGETHSGEEILMIFTRSEETGEIDLDEVEMIGSVFGLGDMIARETVVLRLDVETVSVSMTLSGLRSVAVSETYTRYIVLNEDGEQPIEFVRAKDIPRASETETDHGNPVTARDIAHDILIVPEARRVDAILAEFQTHGGRQIVVVINEWSVFEGIVTIEDILEKIVDGIRGEFGAAPQGPTIEGRDDGTYAADGGMPAREVNERFGVELETDKIEAIGGFVSS